MRMLALMVLVIAAAGVGVEAQEPKAVTMDDIRKAWQARQDRVKSGRFIVEEQVTEARGTYNYVLQKKDGAKQAQAAREKLGLPMPPPGSDFPEQDTTFTVEKEIWFDGGKMRYSYKGNHAFDPNRLTYEWSHYLSVFDGKVAKSLDVDGSHSHPWPTGHVPAEPRPIDAKVPSARPVMMAYRALDPRLRVYDLEAMSVTGGRSRINGAACIELRQKSPGQYQELIWVDPARDFVITRCHSAEGDSPRQTSEWRYEHHPEHGWVPTGWTFITYGNGKALKRSQIGTVKYWEINKGYQDSDFDIRFPERSMVMDERGGARRIYVIHKGGAERRVLPHEYEAGHERLMSSREGEAFGPNPSPWYSWSRWLIAGLIGVVAMGLFVHWRRTRGRLSAAA